MRTLLSATLFAGLAITVHAAKQVPRPMENFSAPNVLKAPLDLSAFKGKVLYVEFLHTTCPHCQNTAKMITRLQKEYGPRGFQAVGYAFNDEVQGHPEVVTEFVRNTGASFPIGIAQKDRVLGYLGVSVMARWGVPMIMVVDKKGMVRAQSADSGSEDLVAEQPLRMLLEKLLSEGAPTPSVSAVTKTPTTASTKK